MSVELEESRDRLVAAALRVAYSERGGLDHRDAADELELAYEIFDAAVGLYAYLRSDVISGDDSALS